MILSSETGQDHIANPDKIDNKENRLYSTIQRLSGLSALEYDKVRKAEAKALGVRVAILDKTVRGTRKGS